MNQFLRPFEQRANLCGMTYFPPFAVMGTHKLSDDELIAYVDQYGKLINMLQQNLTINDFNGFSFLNDIPHLQT